MFESFINNEFLRAFVVFVLFFFALRGAFLIFMKVFSGLTKKTKTTLDDKLIKHFSLPLTIVTFVLAISFSIKEITFDSVTQIILNNSLNTIQVLMFGYLLYVFLDIIFLGIWSYWAKKTKSKVDDILGSLLSGVLKAGVIVISLVFILKLWGVDIGPFLAGIGIAGLAIALALQSTLANVFAGISMIFDRSIRTGDLVYLDATSNGKIKTVGLRSTRIVTFDNETLIVPNSKLAESIIHNVALPAPKTRVVVPFGVSYGTDVSKVKKLVLKEIKKVENFDDSEDPVVRFLEMADSSLNFKAYFYVKTFNVRANALDEANTRIYNILNKNNIEIPFPQIDVNLRK